MLYYEIFMAVFGGTLPRNLEKRLKDMEKF